MNHYTFVRRRMFVAATLLLGACHEADDVAATGSTVLVKVTDLRGVAVNDAEVTVRSVRTTGSVSYTKPADEKGTVTFTDVRPGVRLEFAVMVPLPDVSRDRASATPP